MTQDIMNEPKEIWHYAVWKGQPFMLPACWTRGIVFDPNDTSVHGQTKNRGDVDCVDCLMMMDGLTVKEWLRQELRKEYRAYVYQHWGEFKQQYLYGDGKGPDDRTDASPTESG